MHQYTITIDCQTERALTEAQRITMEEELMRAIDEDANLPLDADLTNCRVREA